MTVELACRLLENRILPRIDVAAALQDAAVRGVAFVQALIERVPSAASVLDSEFSRWSGPTVTALAVDGTSFARLPNGMCARLLALPVQQPDSPGTTTIAVVDPFDQHVLVEFQYWLGTAVKPVRVTYTALMQALVGEAGAEKHDAVDGLLDVPFEDETPAFGTRMLRVSRKPPGDGGRRGVTDTLLPVSKRGFTLPSVDPPEPVSEPAIPLVRTTLKPTSRGAASHPAAPQHPVRGQRDSEPVLRLVKQKPSIRVRRVSVPPPRFSDPDATSPEVLLAAIDQAKSPRHLIELMRDALEHMAPCQAYFSIRSGRYALEWGSGIDPKEVAAPRLTIEQQVVFGKACQTGYFLGPLPPDGDTRSLGTTLGLRAREEIYVAPVQVATRPALLVIVGRFDEAFAVTRWVDAVVARGGQVLERLARSRR